MGKRSLLALILVGATAAACAQVMAPAEIKDPELRALQQQYLDDLKLVGRDILALQLDYHFYLSRKLDLDESQQQHTDQRSIRFDHYNGQTVLAVTGNYFAAYPETIPAEQRARRSFLNVVMPILQAEVPRFQGNHQVQGYAVEISHHILAKVLGVTVEKPENLMVFLPQSGALQLLGSRDENLRQAGLMQGQVFLDAQPVTIWLNAEGPQFVRGTDPKPNSEEGGMPSAKTEVAPASTGNDVRASTNVPATSAAKANDGLPAPVRDTSPGALAALEVSDQEVIARLVKELDAQAHFVPYASQSFVVFRQGIYLELSVSTVLPGSATASRYKLAALAFDDHVALLIRPTLAYFKAATEFDGLSFSTTVRPSGKMPPGSKSEAVEFFFPFAALRCYEKYDCTGQQLIDAGAVLINGERVSLDLQVAEGSPDR